MTTSVRSYYRIDTGDGNELSDGIQQRVVAERAAQERADRRGETVYLSGPDCEDEPVWPRATVTVHPGKPTTHDVPGGIDHDVTVRFGARGVAGGITLVDGRPYGDTIDTWVGGPLEKWLRGLPESSRRAVVESLAAGEGSEEIEVRS